MVTTVVNIMLPSVTVLKNCYPSTKLHFVSYSYFCLSYRDRLLASDRERICSNLGLTFFYLELLLVTFVLTFHDINL